MSLRDTLLDWVYSRGRWIQKVPVEIAFGALFLFFPHMAINILEIRPSPEVEALFRLYGTVTIARGILHHCAFTMTRPDLVKFGHLADLVFALPSAIILITAVDAGLAGSVTWAIIALFSVETIAALIGIAGLWNVSEADLQNALRKHSGDTH